MITVRNYQSLLEDFRALPRLERRLTFMEVAGYPHYENVCSNILRFFLDPNGEHGLGDLVLRSTLNMAGREDLEISGELTLIREYQTPEDKRIDLVIQDKGYVVGIENKIYHWEANDFSVYARTLRGCREKRNWSESSSVCK